MNFNLIPDALPPLFWAEQKRDTLQLTGRDRQSFLQGMVTNDIAKLQPGDGCYAFMLDATGHVLADMRVLCLHDKLLLDLEPGMAPFVLQTLDKYLIMEKCRIADVSADWTNVVYGGENSASQLHAEFNIQAGTWQTEGTHAVVSTNNGENEIPCVISRSFTASVPLFCVRYPNQGKSDIMYVPLKHFRTTTLDDLRIEAGIPRFGTDITSKVLALETGQQTRAIAFRKGCYIGQEIVARIDARGHTNRTFCGFYVSEDALPLLVEGTPVYAEDGAEAGRITSFTVAPTMGLPIALGYIRREFSSPHTEVSIGGSPAQVARLPFWSQAA